MEFKEALPYVYAGYCIHIPKNGYYVKRNGNRLDAHDKVDGSITFRRWFPNADAFYSEDWETWYSQMKFTDALGWLKKGYGIARLSWPKGTAIKIGKNFIGEERLGVFEDNAEMTKTAWEIGENVDDLFAEDWVAIDDDWQIVDSRPFANDFQ